ncbi:succinate dehydrogenase/fumarate reductase cytochrome b subunit [Lipingzhangella halophila]|uniref:Succinate dehydrogenase/fumarate reductase cytochrome b subunit n=1 Tax=Lipingzhangella halophila TaxID=1783352 RepID=A0A7W7W619_9ACTN|nr:pilin [Lipingzhangella halophila]MBB4934425.1 succinate dehydrogenase/fumarate reductase cytochrome b subunit [Lipingzhangella halophila]
MRGQPDPVLAVVAMVLVLVVGDSPALAQSVDESGVEELVDVVGRIRTVIVALAAALATLFATIAGIRWLLAGGDPSEIDRAKRALVGAAIGYGIAILATVLMGILEYIVGEPPDTEDTSEDEDASEEEGD